MCDTGMLAATDWGFVCFGEANVQNGGNRSEIDGLSFNYKGEHMQATRL